MFLRRLDRYDRFGIRSLFEPSLQGKLGGAWQSGIVQTPSDSGNFIFLVTLGGKRYHDVLYEDGYIRWWSQDKQRLDMPSIQRFVAHDSSQNNIHLFIRCLGQREYVYLGLLEYIQHDLEKQKPCEFVWRVMRWGLSGSDLTQLRLPFSPPLMPVRMQSNLPMAPVKLLEVAPPRRLAKPIWDGAQGSATKQTAGDVDWALRDERNRNLGDRGEKLVLQHEIAKLVDAGRQDLADQVEHVALVDSRAGYDIRSFEVDGRELRIEVKTTAGPKSAAFFISANEVRASAKFPEEFRIYRVFQIRSKDDQAGFYVLKGDVTEVLDLVPSSYRALPLAVDEAD
ncbi:DUF3427 domain-containing protein [Roseateles sp.]|uniref:DUF3427 domain-containing protein n=1 Tax=Roseateles sp. TaxID=1971397 RepID=UPI002F3F26D7